MADARLIDLLAPDIRVVRRLRWPGSEREVGLLALRCNEMEDAEVDAREHIRKRGLDIDAPTSADLLARELQVQLAFRMLVDPESKGQPQHRLFRSADEVRARLDPDARGYFVGWAAHAQAAAVAGWVVPPAAEPEE